MTKDEALNIAIDYMNERLEEHDAKFQRHPVAEAERNNILADIKAIKQALAQPEQEPVAWRAPNWGHGDDEWVYRDFDDPVLIADGKPSPSNEPLYTTPPQRKPLTDEEIWVLTSEYNDYDQHGEYFEAIFIGKPTSKQIQKHCHVTEQGAVHILNGGGRVKYEDQWYNLRKEKAAHGIKGEA